VHADFHQGFFQKFFFWDLNTLESQTPFKRCSLTTENLGLPECHLS